MGLFSNDTDDDDSATATFKPVATDGNRVLGYLNSDDGTELVWIPDSAFRSMTTKEFEDTVGRVIE